MSIENLDRGKIDRIKCDLKTEKEIELSRHYDDIISKVNSRTKRAIELAKEKGASTWLTALPLKSMGYILNKQEFRDSISLRYGWTINDILKHCACGKKNEVNHSLDCKQGGYVSMRHNAIRDTEANLLREVCKDVRTEPTLLPANKENLSPRTNSQPGARLEFQPEVSGLHLKDPFMM